MAKINPPIKLTAVNGDTVVITDAVRSRKSDQFDGYIVRTGEKHRWDDGGRCRDNPHWNLDMREPGNQELWKQLGWTDADIAERLQENAKLIAKLFPESGSAGKKSTP